MSDRGCRNVALAAVIACGGAQQKPPTVPADTGDLPDVNDRCPNIPDGCAGSKDVDGCPDVSLVLGPQCVIAGRNADTLRVIADEMKTKNRLTTLGIVASDKDCAAHVVTELAAAGVASRIQSRIAQRRGLDLEVHFEVLGWDGKRCNDGRGVTPPG